MSTSNYTMPAHVIESQQGALVGMQIFLLSIALLFCCLRLVSRFMIVQSLGVDDYFMMAAMVSSIGLTINACLGAHFGWGKHLYDISAGDHSNVLLVGWCAQLLFTFAASFVKISILAFYLRLATTKTYRVLIYTGIGWLTVWCIVFACFVIFQCNPVDAFWHPVPHVQNPHCVRSDPALIVNGVTNILNDLFVYILPMPMLWRVQLPKKQRIGLLVLFGVGSIACVAGVVRIYYTVQVNDSQDGTWLGYNLWTWEGVEINLAIACACAPAIKPLMIRWFPKIMDSVFGRTTNPSGRNGRSAGNLYAGNNGAFIPMNSQKGGRADMQGSGIHKETTFGWRSEESSHITGSGSGKTTRTGERFVRIGELPGESEESLTKNTFSVTAAPHRDA